MIKPIKVDLPYVSLDDIQKNCQTAKIISSAYADKHSELTAILQYVYHSFYFDKYGKNETADILVGISITEMEHLEILGKLLIKLGVDPVFTRNPPTKFEYFCTNTVEYSNNIEKMLLDDISGEMLAVESYEKMLTKICDQKVSAVISRIILDEELHIKVLKREFEKYCNKK